MSAAAFMLVWAAEKVLAPDVARQVSETFYFVSPSSEALLFGGLLQGGVVVAFAVGLWRTLSYGAVLAMHVVGIAASLPRLVDPFTPPNHLFWAAVPVLALLVVLFALRRRDVLFSLDAFPRVRS